MARYVGPTCKLARREGVDLGLKSRARALETKCNMEKVPGQSEDRRRRLSDYGIQLREKQKVRRMYGVMEKQFRNYYKKRPGRARPVRTCCSCSRASRLVVYRMGFGSTRAEARQLIGHKGVTGQRQGRDRAVLQSVPRGRGRGREKAKKQVRVQNAMALPSSTASPTGSRSTPRRKGVFKRVPDRADLPADINESLIVELVLEVRHCRGIKNGRRR
jgi:small subunit ribosomal protein S4